MLCLYALLGVITGVAAAGFVRGLHLLEDVFDKIAERYTRHILGMLLVGVLMYALMQRFGHYYVEGVGYATVEVILLGQLAGAGLLFLLFLCKLLATTLSLVVRFFGCDLLRPPYIWGRRSGARLRPRFPPFICRSPSTFRPLPWWAWERW